MKTKIISLIIIHCTLYIMPCAFLFAQTTTFNYTGAAQTYTVPTCTYFIIVDVKGAEGATASTGSSIGGNGGRVQANIPVTPGEILYIYVGEKAFSDTGGWNGGGNGGTTGAAGGGASDIRQGGTALFNRVIVASGGGGGGHRPNNQSRGGIGGGTTGGDGWHINQTQVWRGKGGTQTAGGAGGTNGSYGNGYPGALGTGGNADGIHGGGGGGGYYGGGGGSTNSYITGGGGGGGSSYAVSTATGVTHTQDFQSGNGQIIITSIVSTVPVTPGPITGTSSVCAGSSQTYSVSPVAGATSYLWTLPPGWSGSSATNSINATAGATGGSITVKAANSCDTSAASTMAVNLIAALVANAGLDTSICTGSTVTLNASGGTNYFWSPPTGLSCTNCPNPVANPSITTIYEVTVSSGSCPSDSDTIQVIVNPLPVADAGTDVTMCSGNSTPLNAIGGISYNWSPPIGLSDPSIANPVANPAATTTYIVSVTDVNNCTNEDTIIITVEQPPIASFDVVVTAVNIIEFDNTTTSNLPFTSSWDFGDGSPIENTQNATHTYTNPGDYTVQLTANNDCGNNVTSQTVTISQANNVDELSMFNNINIYPNPSQGGVFELVIENINRNKFRISVLDYTGRLVFHSEEKAKGEFRKTLDLSTFSKGVYTIRLESDSRMEVRKLVIQ